jgi:carboxymethylenebutenolidase
VRASVCFFATDIHTATLGKGDDSLEKVKAGALTGQNKAELVVSIVNLFRHIYSTWQMIFGKQDTHVPREGRDLIRNTLYDANVAFSVGRVFLPRRVILPLIPWSQQFLEVQAEHAFVRDEKSKGRWDAALTRNLFGYMMEVSLFHIRN